MKQRIIHSLQDLAVIENAVVASAAAAAESLLKQLQTSRDLSFLARLKFVECGFDPLDSARSLNLVEQLNQSFTYLATIEATKWLFEHHPAHAPFHLNLGTASGTDITSADGLIAAETFAATHPDSNRKLQNDVEKVRTATAKFKYVFYLSPVASTRRFDDVRIVRLDHASMGTLH